MQQPKLKSRVHCIDQDCGEVTRVIVDPLSLEISHIVVSTNGAGGPERQVPTSTIQRVGDDVVELRATTADLQAFPPFNRADYVSIHDVEIAHLEDRVHCEPGEVLVPVPELERNVKRRTFFAAFTQVIGLLIGLPFAFPVLRYLIKPMYAPFDNRWLKVGSTGKIKTENVGVQFKYKKMVKEAFMPEAEVDKNVWILKASSDTLEKIYKGKDLEFRDPRGQVIWTNKKDVPYVVFSGKCPHLGCGYKWRTHKLLGQVFLCPCHLSIYDETGKVLDGPAPRPLDPLPIRVSSSGDIEIIDMEFKAGVTDPVRLV